MNKLLESKEADMELQRKLEDGGRILQDLESWVNHSPDLDLHSIDLFKSDQQYFLMVDFGLLKAVWEITMSELRQLRNKDSVEEVAEFVDQMASEPIIER